MGMQNQVPGVFSWQQKLVSKGVSYWLGFGVIVALSMTLAAVVDGSTAALNVRYWLHEHLTALRPLQRTGQHIVVALVGDDVFYSQLNRARSPISPSLLAALVRRGADAGATTIGLDFDTRYPDPTNPALLGADFEREVQLLEDTIRDVAPQVTVVLPVMLGRGGAGLDTSYLDRLRRTPPQGMRLGLVNLPADMRYVPLGQFDGATGTLAEGFGVALARSQRPDGIAARLLPDHEDKSPMIAFQGLVQQVSAAELLSGDLELIRRTVSGRVLILGGAWHTPTRADEKVVDTYVTPAGKRSGALIHAAYAEATLNGEVFLPASNAAVGAIKVTTLVGIGIAMVLITRLALKAAALAVFVALQLVVGYLAFVNVGVSIDVAIPTLFVFAHAAIDHLMSWHELAIGRGTS